MSETASPSEKLLTDTRGGVMVEYIVLVAVVGLVVVAGFVSRGKATLTDYTNSRDMILLPAQ